MKHILYSNYFWEDDEDGRDKYDYVREDIWEWDDFKTEFSSFLNKSKNGFLLCGTVGTWQGNYGGGCEVNGFGDLSKFWESCDYIEVYDEGGHLYLEASHHDGSNYAELKELTDKGWDYINNHYYDATEEVHNVVFNNNFYSRLPRYAEKVWGCKRGA